METAICTWSPKVALVNDLRHLHAANVPRHGKPLTLEGSGPSGERILLGVALGEVEVS